MATAFGILNIASITSGMLYNALDIPLSKFLASSTGTRSSLGGIPLINAEATRLYGIIQ
jgi:hypothetical protein